MAGRPADPMTGAIFGTRTERWRRKQRLGKGRQDESPAATCARGASCHFRCGPACHAGLIYEAKPRSVCQVLRYVRLVRSRYRCSSSIKRAVPSHTARANSTTRWRHPPSAPVDPRDGHPRNLLVLARGLAALGSRPAIGSDGRLFECWTQNRHLSRTGEQIRPCISGPCERRCGQDCRSNPFELDPRVMSKASQARRPRGRVPRANRTAPSMCAARASTISRTSTSTCRATRSS